MDKHIIGLKDIVGYKFCVILAGSYEERKYMYIESTITADGILHSGFLVTRSRGSVPEEIRCEGIIDAFNAYNK